MRQLAILLLLIATSALAAPSSGELYLNRHTELAYEELSAQLQGALLEEGWTVHFVQPVDEGLASRGHQVGLYRVLVVEPEGAGEAIAKDASLAALLPLRITVYDDGAGLALSTTRPSVLARAVKDPALQRRLADWDRALHEILASVSPDEIP